MNRVPHEAAQISSKPGSAFVTGAARPVGGPTCLFVEGLARVTKGIESTIERAVVREVLTRHERGEWGEISPEQMAANYQAIRNSIAQAELVRVGQSHLIDWSGKTVISAYSLGEHEGTVQVRTVLFADPSCNVTHVRLLGEDWHDVRQGDLSSGLD